MSIQESWKRKKTGVWVLCVFNTELKQEAIKRRIHLSTFISLASVSSGVPSTLLDFLYTPDILYPSADLPILIRDFFFREIPHDTVQTTLFFLNPESSPQQSSCLLLCLIEN